MGKKHSYIEMRPCAKASLIYVVFEEGGMIETEPGVYSRSYQILQPEKEAKYSITTR